MVAERNNTRRVQTLVGLLGDIADAHSDLLVAVEDKIVAMREADTERIERSIRREQSLIERINEKEGLRRQITENIARGYGISPSVATRLNATQLATRVGGAHASAILVAARRLKDLTARIARRNHVAQLISQNILRHIKHVFAAMTVSGDGSVGYSQAGEVVTGSRERIFDTVG